MQQSAREKQDAQQRGEGEWDAEAVEDDVAEREGDRRAIGPLPAERRVELTAGGEGGLLQLGDPASGRREDRAQCFRQRASDARDGFRHLRGVQTDFALGVRERIAGAQRVLPFDCAAADEAIGLSDAKSGEGDDAGDEGGDDGVGDRAEAGSAVAQKDDDD